VKKLILIGLILFGSGVLVSGISSAMSVTTSQDCDDNAMIRCGASSSSEMSDKIQASGMEPVFARFGISGTDVANLDSNAVPGVVTRSGDVILTGQSDCQQFKQRSDGSCIVATGAMTAGRQNIAGSTMQSSGGITFFERPPSVSFASSQLPAFVVMNNSRFDFAIIASCGNPVKATPVVVPKVKAATTAAPAKPVQPAPVQPPSPTQSQTQSQSQTVNVTQPAAPAVVSTPAPAPPAAAAAPAATAALPNTGPGPVLGIGGLSTVLGTVGHLIYTRRRSAA
jgi:hypothetical protein